MSNFQYNFGLRREVFAIPEMSSGVPSVPKSVFLQRDAEVPTDRTVFVSISAVLEPLADKHSRWQIVARFVAPSFKRSVDV